MFAVKENRCYTINESDRKTFVKDGYDILDEKGNVIEYGAGKTIAFSEYMKVKEECEALKKELAALKKSEKKTEKDKEK